MSHGRLAGRVRDLPLHPSPVAQPVDGPMPRNAEQVRHQASTPAGLDGDVLPQDAIGVEHDFLGLVPILEHGLRHAEEPWAGQLDQLDQGLLIARDQALPKRELPLRC